MIAPNPGEEVLAEHVYGIANLINGSATGQNIPAAFTDYSGTGYPLAARNQSTSSAAPAFKASVNTGVNQVDIIDATAARTIIRNLLDKGGQVYNVKAYGAVGNSVTDDTAAIQAAINAARQNSGGVVYFPNSGPNTYLCGGLDVTNCSGITLMGTGWQSTRLTISSGQGSTNWIDCTGSAAITICMMQFGTTSTASASAEAECGILLGAMSGSGAANAVHLGPGLRIGGRFSKAALYCYGVPSWDAVDSDFYNYYQGASRVGWFTATNAGAAASDYVTIATVPSGATDITLVGCEFHELSRYNDGAAAATAIPLTLDAVQNWKMIGGNISGNNATQYVELLNGAAATAATFENVTMYREGTSGTIPANGFKINTGGTSNHVRGLVVSNLALQATTGFFAGVAGAQYTGLMLGPWTASGPSYIISFDGGGGTLTESDLWCNGLQVNSSTITGGVLRAPGTVTAATTDSSIRIGNGYLAVASANNVPSTTGLIRLPTQAVIGWRGGGIDLQGITTTNTDRVQIGATTNVVGTILNGTTDHDFQIAGTSKAKVTSAGLKPTRLVGDSVATALATGNFASLSAGWGTSASCSAVARHEMAGRFTITAGSASVSGNPTLIFTYPGGAYAVIPEVFVTFIGGTGAGTFHQASPNPSTSSCTIQFFFTPVVNLTYTYQIIVIG